jgi:exosortase A-associated hydrolase 1
MAFDESVLAFACGGDALYGVLSRPRGACRRGVLIVVGGPQYRAGSHRQFTLLARHLAREGIAAMRFDYRGMGDSEGAARDFEAVADDLRAALDAFTGAVPELREVVLWGLCDAASAIAMYAAADARVSGLVLLNPWVRTEGGSARATLKHYYRARLLDPAFWRKLGRGRFDAAGSLKSMLGLARSALRKPAPADDAGLPFVERMRQGLEAFGGPVLVIIGGADLTGREFCDLGGADPAWQRMLAGPRVTRHQIDKADHTFSRRVWRDQVADWTCAWMRDTGASPSGSD